MQALLIYALVVAALIAIASMMNANRPVTAASSGQKGARGAQAALVRVEGVIVSSGGDSGMFGGSSGASSYRIVRDLKKYAEDDSIAGIIIRIDSPGGSAAASDEIWNAVYKARMAKPVVVSMGDVAASGGYYVASAAEVIYANPATLTGSIGVIYDSLELSGLFEKLGISSNTIHAGEFKDIGSISRPMTGDERSMIQALLDQVHEQFIERVSEGREMELDEVKPLATGMIYTGEQAKENGLVDELGGFEDAFAKLEELTGKKLSLREPKMPTFWDFMMGAESGVTSVMPRLRQHPLELVAQSLFLNTLLFGAAIT